MAWTSTAYGRSVEAVEAKTVPSGFVWWGYATIIVAFVTTYLFGPFWPVVTPLRNFSVVSGMIWVLVALMGRRLTFKVCWPVGLLLLLQVWGTFSTAYVGAYVGRNIPFNYSDVLLLRYIPFYFIASYLVQIDGKHRGYLFRALMVLVGLNAIVQYLQFLHFGPALALSGATPSGIDIEAWDTREGTRAVGFYTYPGMGAINGAMICAYFAGSLAYRKLTIGEHLLFFFFAGASFIAQARTHMVGLGIIFLFYAYALTRSERERAPAILLGLGGVLAGMMAVAWDRLAYAFGENWLTAGSLRYRAVGAWQQTGLILKDFPWTGVGPDPSVLSNRMYGVDKWAPRAAVESGWLALQAQFGLIGLAIAFVAAFLTVLTPIFFRKNPNVSTEQKSLAVTVALMGLCLSLGMLGNTVLHWETPFFILMVAGGSLTATRQEQEAIKDRTQAAAA